MCLVKIKLNEIFFRQLYFVRNGDILVKKQFLVKKKVFDAICHNKLYYWILHVKIKQHTTWFLIDIHACDVKLLSSLKFCNQNVCQGFLDIINIVIVLLSNIDIKKFYNFALTKSTAC